MKKSLFIPLAAMLMAVPKSQAQINLNDSVPFVSGANEEYASILNYMQRAMRFNIEVPHEKVYLHLDNTGYFKGETIWFKAYVVSALENKPTPISSVLYVELVTPAGDVIDTKKLYVENGQAEGCIHLENVYETGFYEIRAYTRYMTNWGNAAIFSRVIPVFNAPLVEGDYSHQVMDIHSYKKRMPDFREVPEVVQDPSSSKKDDVTKVKVLPKGKINVNFYPEGGHFVQGVPCRMAFSINDSEGRYFDTEGKLLDSKGNDLNIAMTYSKGRGYFEVKSDGTPCYLEIKTADDKTQKFMLPEAEPEGVSLIMNTLSDEKVVANLHSSSFYSGRLFGYALMHNGKIYSADTITCVPDIKISFDREALPKGVNQLTFIDADGDILAERLFFICPKPVKEDSIEVTTTQKVISPCGKVVLDVKARPNANISLSVMDDATLTNAKVGNAKTWMLLGSEVKGFIDHPEYYFEADDKYHRMDADLLMLVQGWRRYRWGLMSGTEKFNKIQNIEDSLYIKGQVAKKYRDYVMPGVDLSVFFFNDKGDWLRGKTVTDENGNFAFAAPNMSGKWNMQFMTRVNGEPKNLRVMVDRRFSPQARWLSPYETEQLMPQQANVLSDTPDSMYVDFENTPIRKRDHVLPNVRVNARHRIFDNARQAWETEAVGKKWAWIYYNMEEECEKLIDEGETILGVEEWLYSRNPAFTGRGANRHYPTKEKDNIVTADKSREVFELGEFVRGEENSGDGSGFVSGHSKKIAKAIDATKKKSRFYGYDLGFNKRPIVWILNNKFSHITSSENLAIRELVDLSPVSVDYFPDFIDEVKSIYISDAPSAYRTCVISSDLDAHNAVTIFVYTKMSFSPLIKGLSRSHFQSFDMPETFHMDDYSVLPPMEDYRRTIYWDPNVKTDSEGKARVQFFNNSSAKRLYVSAEGITSDGHILVNE